MTTVTERTALTIALMLIVGGIVVWSITLGPVARTSPLVVGIPTLVLMALTLVHDVIRGQQEPAANDRQRAIDERRLLGWLGLLIGLVAVAGVALGVPLWLCLFLRFRSGEPWTVGIAIGGGLMMVLFAVFSFLLRIDPLSGSVATWFW